MNRREFLRGAGTSLLVLPFGTFLVHCSSGSDGGTVSTTNPTTPTVDNTPPDAPPSVSGANIVYTSSSTTLHSHSFSIPAADFTSPPFAGVSGTTTEAQFHSHFVAVTQANLQNVEAGQTVKVETNTVDGHTHTFTFVRVG
jgi:hypothetical protein